MICSGSSSTGEFSECREVVGSSDLAGVKAVEASPFVDEPMMNFSEGGGVVAPAPMRPSGG